VKKLFFATRASHQAIQITKREATTLEGFEDETRISNRTTQLATEPQVVDGKMAKHKP
jgi:hypothetical protein